MPNAADAAKAWLETEATARASLRALSAAAAFDTLTRTRDGAAVLAVSLDPFAYEQTVEDYLAALMHAGQWERWGILKGLLTAT